MCISFKIDSGHIPLDLHKIICNNFSGRKLGKGVWTVFKTSWTEFVREVLSLYRIHHAMIMKSIDETVNQAECYVGSGILDHKFPDVK